MPKKSKAELEDEQKESWLAEHLPYELKMLRHTYKRLVQGGLHYLDWNAAHAAFAVSARNLVAFLTNNEKGSNNFQANDFAASFRSRKGELASTINKVDPQLFHLGKSRPTEAKGKFDTADAKIVLDWIENEMAKFLAALSSEKRALWKEDRATLNPEDIKPDHITVFGDAQTTSAADPVSVLLKL